MSNHDALTRSTSVAASEIRSRPDHESGDNPRLSKKPTKRNERKSLEHTGRGLLEQLRSFGRRLRSEADPEDLHWLWDAEAELKKAQQAAVDGQRERHSDSEIGRALGMTKQNVQKRFPRR